MCGKGLDTIKTSGKYPCGVCRKGVGRNSIYCSSCKSWVHKKCSGIKRRLTDDPDFKCNRCLGLSRPIDSRPVEHVFLGSQKLDVVDSFVYLGDGISPCGGCVVSTIARTRAAWGKFRELLPLLTNQSIPLKDRGRVYSSCIRSVMLYGSECWALTTSDFQRLQRNERAMIRWICRIKASDRIASDILLQRLCLKNLDTILRTNRLRWYGHVCRSSGSINKSMQYEVMGKRKRGRPRKTWHQCIEDDLKIWKIPKSLTSDRNAWRNALRMAKSPTRKKCGTWAQTG